MSLKRLIGLTIATCILAMPAFAADRNAISLDGKWRFALDSGNAGISEKWFEKTLSDSVKLPGSTDENKKGVPNTRKPDLQHLYRPYEYTGPAWYQRDIVIPREWKGKRVILFLERCHWETRVWLDGKARGMADSLCTPHIHELGIDLTPGTHRLTIRVDNTIKYDVGGWAHSITEETQTNWNGIVGRIELRATPPVWIESIQVYPNAAAKTIKVKALVRSERQKPFLLGLAVNMPSGRKPVTSDLIDDKGFRGGKTLEAVLPLPDAELWDEFSPNLYTLVAVLTLEGQGEQDMSLTSFGLRDLGVRDKRLVLNGRKIFIRGTLECCIFPRTGYPPTDLASWLRVIKIAKSYGLNSLRFHSWCPPEAAFAAADQMGFLLHVEAPQWVGNVGKDKPRDEFIKSEVLRILDTYGNHPSFGMLCMGNELGGDTDVLQDLVTLARQHDPRHLYTSSTAWSLIPANDYNVAAVRGLHGPGTDADFREADAKFDVPIISHEVGQWSVFPNLAEIPKYTGVTRARNFEIVRDDLKAKGMLDQAAAFTQATGKLSVELYKEEIEALLRTPGHGGFQLLDLHDFPGQGTALIGILDAFWDAKGIITPAEYRRFCGPTVPLLRMPRRTYTSDETFTAQAQVAHFGPSNLPNAIPQWSLTDSNGRLIASGMLSARTIPTGELTDLGSISVPLNRAAAPAELTVTVSLKDTDASNSWHIWVYPARISTEPPVDVTVTRSPDEAISALKAAKKVLLLASAGSLVQSRRGSFTPVFWSPILFKAQAKTTMSILCDPSHPALSEFPTDSYTNWQWYDLLTRSHSMVLDGTPAAFRPIVQVIDNFTLNAKLGVLVEARVGEGRLMVCSIDLSNDLDKRPAASQLLHSILDYMGSNGFDPPRQLTFDQLATFVGEPKQTFLQSLGSIVTADNEDTANGNVAANAIDGDPATFWHTQWGDVEPPCPHEIRIDMRKPLDLTGFKYLPRQDIGNGWIADYEFYASEDGTNWGAPVAKGTFRATAEEKAVTFEKPCRARFIRLVALSEVNGKPWTSIAELDVTVAQPQ